MYVSCSDEQLRNGGMCAAMHTEWHLNIARSTGYHLDSGWCYIHGYERQKLVSAAEIGH